MDHFNSESAYPGTLASGNDLIVTSIVPALIGMAVVGLIVVLMLQ